MAAGKEVTSFPEGNLLPSLPPRARRTIRHLFAGSTNAARRIVQDERIANVCGSGLKSPVARCKGSQRKSSVTPIKIVKKYESHLAL